MPKERIACWDNPHICTFACRNIHDSILYHTPADSQTYWLLNYTNAWQTHHHDLKKHYEIAQPFPVDSALNLYGIWLVGFLSL